VEPTVYNREGLEGSCDYRVSAHYRHLFTQHHGTIAPLERLHLEFLVITALVVRTSPQLDFSAGGRDAVGVARQTFRIDANRSLERRVLLVAYGISQISAQV